MELAPAVVLNVIQRNKVLYFLSKRQCESAVHVASGWVNRFDITSHIVLCVVGLNREIVTKISKKFNAKGREE
jgi:hypothetical protein